MVPHTVSCEENDDNIPPLVSGAGVTPVVSSRARSFLGLGSSEGGTPACSLQKSDDSFLRHSKYFFVDGDVTFLVNGFLYCVHRHLFKFSHDSAYFSTQFAQLGVHDHEALSAIVSLEDVEREDFEAFLSVLYPEGTEGQVISYEQWRSVLHLSTRWGFASLRELALRSIKPPTPCDRLLLARTYAVDNWVAPALTALCKRAAPLSQDEVGRMSEEDVVLVATIREDIHTQTRLRAAEISRRVEAMQAGVRVRAEGNDVSPASSAIGVPHPDGWSVAGAGAARAQPKASDSTQFGKIDKATSMNFTPTSISSYKEGDPKSLDSPMSGTASSSSMSSMPQNTNTSPIICTLPSALATARYIEDLNCITYPEGIKSPKAELNANAQNRKFRYDRDFLLQFMNICKEKPDDLQPLDVLGIEPRDTSPSMPRGGSRRSVRSSTSIGLGFLPGMMGKSPGSGFQMGQFSTSASKMSSEERFAASASRSSSVSGPLGGRPPAMGTISQGGTKTRDRTRSKRGATKSNRLAMESFTLEVSTNRWVAWSTRRGGSDPNSESREVVEHKVKALLNKLTMVRFDSISDQIIAWANKSEMEKDGRTLIQVIKLIFESLKEAGEAIFSEMYARLCRKMMEQISPKVRDDGIKNSEGKPFAGGNLFRKYLLNRCHEDFEHGWVAKEATALAAATKASPHKAIKEANEKTKGREEFELYSDEYYAAANTKRRRLNLIRFIGELFKLQMLTERNMHESIKKLLGNAENPEEEEIEGLCKLLTTVGSRLDTPKARAHIDVYFSRMLELTKDKNVNARMMFMLQDVIELRERKWIPRNSVATPTTIAQVHEAASEEKLAREKDASLRQVSPMSFVPTSVFNSKNGGPKSRDSSMSRTMPSSHMFSMLQISNVTVDPPPSESSRAPSHKPGVDLGVGGPSEPPRPRRKLQLLPRKKNKLVGERSKVSTPQAAVSEADSDDEAAREGGTSALV